MLTSIIVNILIATLQLSDKSNYKLPKTWTAEFTITADYNGSMDGSASKLVLTFDSLVYKHTSYKTEKGNYSFKVKLTAADRAEILKKLNDLNVEKISNNESKIKPFPVHDGYTQTLCIGQVCISGGPGSSLNNSDSNTFSTACAFLEEFATKKYQGK